MQRKTPEGRPLSEAMLSRRLLPAFVQDAVGSLEQSMIDRLTHNILSPSVPAGTATVITIGTMCSGSEMYLASLPHLEQMLSKATGNQVVFKHLWSCEFNRAKREWIYDNFHPPKFLCDVTHLSGVSGAYDDVSGYMQVVDPVDVIIAGTSCKDASRLNPHHADGSMQWTREATALAAPFLRW